MPSRTILCLLAALLLAAGCAETAYPPMGDSARMAALNQKINPSPAPDYPVTGFDGVKGRVMMEIYQTGMSTEQKEVKELESTMGKMQESQ